MASKTGNRIIDALQDAQLHTYEFADTALKIAQMEREGAYIGATALLGSQLLVTARIAFTKHPDAAPDIYDMYPDGLTFFAKADTYSYLCVPDVSVDSLAIDFVEPTVLEADFAEDARFKQLLMRVPILDIESCIDMANPYVIS